MPSTADTARHTDAIFLGICAAVREGPDSSDFVTLPVDPPLEANAHFALVTLAGRTASASLGFLRRFVTEHLRD